MIEIYHSSFSVPNEIREEEVNLIIIENPELLYKILYDLNATLGNQDSELSLLDNHTKVSNYNNVEFVNNFLDIDINNKKIINILHKKIIKKLNENFFPYSSIYVDLCTLFCDTIFDFDVEITFNDEIDAASIVKLLNPRIEFSQNKLIEILVNYVDLLVDILGLKIIILFNLEDFLSQDDVIQFIKHCYIKEVRVLLILHSQKYHYDKCHLKIIDNDLCEILE